MNLIHSNVHEGPAIAPANESMEERLGAVTRPTGRREYVPVGSTAAVPAADACQSSIRFGTGIVFHIEKLDKKSKSTNFHSKRFDALSPLILLDSPKPKAVFYSITQADRTTGSRRVLSKSVGFFLA